MPFDGATEKGQSPQEGHQEETEGGNAQDQKVYLCVWLQEKKMLQLQSIVRSRGYFGSQFQPYDYDLGLYVFPTLLGYLGDLGKRNSDKSLLTSLEMMLSLLALLANTKENSLTGARLNAMIHVAKRQWPKNNPTTHTASTNCRQIDREREREREVGM